jgi:hypothetical protein
MKLVDIVEKLCSGNYSQGESLRCDEDGSVFIVGPEGLLSVRIGAEVFELGTLLVRGLPNHIQPGQ